MPNNTKNTNKTAKKSLKKSDDLIEIDEPAETPRAITEELDPDVATVLESKKKKKIPNPSEVDYIPELERDVDFSDNF